MQKYKMLFIHRMKTSIHRIVHLSMEQKWFICNEGTIVTNFEFCMNFFGRERDSYFTIVKYEFSFLLKKVSTK